MDDISSDIIMRARQGDIDAFEEIYRATSGFVYSVTLRITNNREDAEEATQDVFVKIHRSLKYFEFKSSFRTWAYRIAVNTALNISIKRSRQARSRSDDYDAAIETVASPVIGAREQIDRQNDERAVSDLLKVLNPGQRACVVLREIESLSYKEISEALRININTVRSRLKRARMALLRTYRKAG